MTPDNFEAKLCLESKSEYICIFCDLKKISLEDIL